jgi:predicted glycoside hydrolase/deacetylase ChbG (UPF0249 family)
MAKIIINGDDFGISSGVNHAIIKAYKDGVLNSASLMANMDYVDEALRLFNESTDGGLNIGLHFNLTVGKALSSHRDIPLLTDNNGNFNCGFLKLLVYSVLYKKQLAYQLEKEARAQIEKAINMGVKLSHIDSHRHIHTIPLLNKIIKKLAAEYGIPRVRVINESFKNSLNDVKDFGFLFDGGLVKYGLLTVLERINKSQSNTCFFSVLYTGKLDKSKVRRFTVDESKYDSIEVMIHPSITEIDVNGESSIPDANLVLSWRDKEFESLMDKTLWKCN